jgi:hypothetical protein
MKSIMLFVLVAVLATIGLKAQPIFNFGLNLNWAKTETSNQPLYNPVTVGAALYPRVGYLITDIIAVGVGGGSSISQTTYLETDITDLTVYKRNTWFVSPFVRFYFSDSNKLRFLIDCSMRYGKSKTATFINDSHTEPDKTYKNTGYYLEPAVSYEVNDHLSIEMSIGNLRYTSTTDNTTGVTSSGYYASMGLETITGRMMYTFGNKRTRKNESLDKFK